MSNVFSKALVVTNVSPDRCGN